MSEYNPFSLKGRSVLVTGASSGIGRATAVECARLGAKLILTGRDTGRLRETLDALAGDGHRQVPADLTADGDLAELVAACPTLEGVALCAGAGRTLPFKSCGKDVLSEVFAVNFSAPTELLRLLLKAKKIADAASVVFVSSVAASSGGVAAGHSAYGASKAALVAEMRHLAREFGSRGIRFNTVNPGLVETPFVGDLRTKMTAEQIAADLARYPLGRYGRPDDVAHGIAYLLSDAASWVTGHQLVIDGGLTI